MKAISVRQPWAHLIVSGIKCIENRDWNTNYRGPLFIHAGSHLWEGMSVAEIEKRYHVRIPDDFPRGAIIGIVDLIDVVTSSNDRFFSGPFGLVLRNARPLPPITMLGRSRIFNVSLSVD